MNGRQIAGLVLIAGLVGVPQRAGADVVYDNISANSWHSSFFPEDEYADDTSLSTGAGTTIRQVEVGVLRTPNFPGTYSGTMTVRLWADGGGAPGAFLGSASVPVSLSDNVPHIVAASFAGVIAPTATIWTGVQFSYITQVGAGIVEGTALPSVGTTTSLRARHYPDNSWGVFGVGSSNEFIRINTVPAPWAVCVLGIHVLGTLARRRGV